MPQAECPYCDGSAPGRVVWSSPRCRVLLIEDSPFVGLCRVVWSGHVKELTDLPQDDRAHVFQVLCATETALRELLSPDKMNIAALGTAMPHLHWHVVPRYAGDTHFPEPIWSTPLRDVTERKLPHGFAEDLVVALRSRL